MSHITVVISRAQAAPSNTPSPIPVEMPTGVNYASVSYTVPDTMSDEDVARMCRKLYRQMKDMGD